MPRQLSKEGDLFVTEVTLPFKNQLKQHEIRLVLDTGAAVTVIDTDIIDQLGYSAQNDGIRRSALDGAGGKSVGYMVKLPTFQCLDFQLNDFEIACHDMDTRLGVAGLLGMNFLSKFRIDINYQTGEIYEMELLPYSNSTPN